MLSGGILKARRLTLGMTMDELARQSGVAESYICKIEKGVRSAAPAVWERIEAVLNQEEQRLRTPESISAVVERAEAYLASGAMNTIRRDSEQLRIERELFIALIEACKRQAGADYFKTVWDE